MAKKSIRSEFIFAFTLVLLCSFLATLFVWGAAFYALWSGSLRPANYYEKRIPVIKKYADAKGSGLLNSKERQPLEQIIPAQGIAYQIVDIRGKTRYGTIDQPTVSGARDLAEKINTQRPGAGKGVTTFLPLTDSQGILQGALVLQYKLSASSVNPEHPFLIAGIGLACLAAPFLFTILFAFLFGKRLSKKMGKPIRNLIDGARRIQQRDLDFSLAYEGTNEIAKLTQSFEDMRRELQHSLQREWELEQERRDMVAAIAHDMRTPLTIIQGHVEGLLEGGRSNPARLEKYLGTIEQNTKRAARMLEEMNVVSEIDRPDFVLQPMPVQFDSFFKEKAEEYRLLCLRNGVSFDMQIEKKYEGEEGMSADPYRILQVLDNLIANSLRFTPERGTIECRAVIQKDSVAFTVCDSGPGFPEKELPHLFRKFYKGDASRSVDKGHAGLGLYIAQAIVRKHGGEIRAENRPSGGACVHVTIKALYG